MFQSATNIKKIHVQRIRRSFDLLSLSIVRENGQTMKWKNINLKTSLYCITYVIILLGLGSALFIYLTAKNDEESISGYELSSLENSKKYEHAMELYGGKANVLAEEFRNWFAGLCHGKSLAVTVAYYYLYIPWGFLYC